ncbi:isoprenylcysteine carboxylmethyltransferase family protein [uncultured Shimia sp.]|uniref:methyltransferase family protein n=1 Tax=uncultured Shimia sp. TaxID=573152 RepID=UPI002627D09B|nr:isoprenylcysteine carboxylmethyltransferase family protein [uncultured Shimia sp.]
MTRAGPNIAVYPPAVSVIAPVVAVALEWLVPLAVLPAAGRLLLAVPGAALLGAAGWLAMSGTRAFEKAGTNVDPKQPTLKLVRSGPYRFTRNPMYLGMVVLQLGLALTFSLDWAVLGAAVVFMLLHFGVVLPEEIYLTDLFGAEYQTFLTQTRRWL